MSPFLRIAEMQVDNDFALNVQIIRVTSENGGLRCFLKTNLSSCGCLRLLKTQMCIFRKCHSWNTNPSCSKVSQFNLSPLPLLISPLISSHSFFKDGRSLSGVYNPLVPLDFELSWSDSDNQRTI